MDNKLIGISIAIVVSVILVGSLLMPIIQDADDGQKYTYVNKGYRASEVTADVSYSWDATNGITLSDSTKIKSNTTDGTLVVFACDTGFAKTNYAGSILTFIGYGQSVASGTNITAVNVSIDFESKTITLSNIVASTTIADQTITYNSWCYVPSIDGDKVLYAPISIAQDFYIEDDSSIKGLFYDGGSWMVSLDNDTEVSKYGSSITYTLNLDKADTDYDDLKKISNVVTASGGNYTLTVSGTDYYSAYIVLDREATGITSTGEAISPILFAIPVLIIVAILVFAVRGALKN